MKQVPTPRAEALSSTSIAAPDPAAAPAAASTSATATPLRRRKRATPAAYTLAPLTNDSPDTTQNLAYLALKKAILGGKFYPGTPVTLAKLSEMLGTIDMPIREALKRLTAEGAFEALPNRSPRIPVLSRAVVRQILELRVELESMAAAQAAENMTKRHIDQLQSLDTAMQQALRTGDLSAYVTLNMEFHFLIYRVADNEPLLALIEALWLRMAPVVAVNLAAMAGNHELTSAGSGDHHGRIIKAFQQHDAAAARAEIRADLTHPGALSRYGDAGP